MDKGFWKQIEKISDEKRSQAIANASVALEEAIAESELAKTQEPVRIQQKKNLFGFAGVVEEEILPDAVAAEKKVGEIKSLLDQHNSEVGSVLEIRQKFAAMGFPSVVIITKALFKALCDQAEIFRFTRITEDGKVPAAKLISKKAEEWIEWLHVLLMLLPPSIAMIAVASIANNNFSLMGSVAVLVAGVILVLALEENISKSKGWIIFAIALGIWAFGFYSFGAKDKVSFAKTTILAAMSGFVVVQMVVRTRAEKILKIIAEKIVGAIVAWQAKKLSMKEKLYFLWPKMSDEYIGSKYNATMVAVNFPEAPAAFFEKIQLLLKHKCRPPMIAAHWSAILFNSEELGGLVLQEIDRRRLDPILGVEDGEYVVIVDHFGEVPEKEQLLALAKAECERMMK